ncbi:hypothetical protein R6231_14630 [Bacillus cytotoxicus]|uniref:hypothetical protein n=1 Tax=Bacillus cereus group TaxID=86661 RepID=UPI000B971657|nr:MULTISPECIES: hypothetical protein [Bacillus cereus group]AWC30985.1 hypothetical protein CG483_022465 [Bacillus cytotoxicus]AWC43077.1 hypothetical protein CG480_022300 [Bacillus cytotoxicus]AWC47010.1 hypothetical protein CG479_021650 [Bacillus cytotoxicus]AWC51008.1 hypothetical protein CG478_022300 [Bacillus cytotoxicus]AWC55124.1 hypothetical protein CG477_022705 [Bacillus cytotoxicus]
MAKRTNKNEKSPHQDAVSMILKKQGKTYEEWSQQVVNNNCLSLLQGGNPEWRNKMLEEAAMEEIAAFIVKQENKQGHNIQSNN